MDDTGVFVSESFPLALARKLRDSIDGRADERRRCSWRVTRRDETPETGDDPGLSLVRMILFGGVMKAALGAAATGTAGRYTLTLSHSQ